MTQKVPFPNAVQSCFGKERLTYTLWLISPSTLMAVCFDPPCALKRFEIFVTCIVKNSFILSLHESVFQREYTGVRYSWNIKTNRTKADNMDSVQPSAFCCILVTHPSFSYHIFCSNSWTPLLLI